MARKSHPRKQIANLESALARAESLRDSLATAGFDADSPSFAAAKNTCAVMLAEIDSRRAALLTTPADVPTAAPAPANGPAGTAAKPAAEKRAGK